MQTVLGAREEAGRDRREQKSVPGCTVASYSCGGKWRVLFTCAAEKRFVHSLPFLKVNRRGVDGDGGPGLGK